MSLAKPDSKTGEYFENWGITPTLRSQIINAALSRGGEDCDLFFQHSASTSVRLSDGKVNQASTHVDLGMGVRVVIGEQIGYSYSEDLSPAALIAAAKAAAEIAATTPNRTAEPEKDISLPNYYSMSAPWEQVNMQTRVNMLQQWEGSAFGLIHVSVAWKLIWEMEPPS